ncbi:hypothetical protein N0B31_06365 [Salinirubellus salinus]|jgi:hypothetical protein|uniref:Uncharacterized protein n=1 Tax=Salinirubellus salinus TaxID=1364945 RepID=A0A9E7R501_9EURY|nr:hypothetical protein [Salinirubellus salinus]UWM55904.1 hypothetical protein N0B31_06365 [Salinirubellus salinus]
MQVATDSERERIALGHEVDWSHTSVVKFERLPVADARTLLDEGYVDPQARVGDSPTMVEILAFCERWSAESPQTDGETSLHGRVVAPEDPETGVYFEGVRYTGPTSAEFVRAFADTFATAQSFMLEKDLHARCWFR